MRKNDRHQLVKTMIKEEKLGTQKEIQDRLEAQGIYVTQTTLSRDLREIGLTKVKKKGLTYYVLAHETEEMERFETDVLTSFVFRKDRDGSRKVIARHAAVFGYQKGLSRCFLALSDGGFL